MTLWADSPQQALRIALQAQPRSSAWHQQLLPALQKEDGPQTTPSASPPCVMAGMVCSIDTMDAPIQTEGYTAGEKGASPREAARPPGKCRRQYLCVSLASGTRCCGAEKQFSTAHPLLASIMIGDGHAEVLARRGSVAFFLDGAEQLLSHLPTTDTTPMSATSPLSCSERVGPDLPLRLYHPFLDYAEKREVDDVSHFASSTSSRRSFGFSWRSSVALHLVVTYWPCGFMARSCAATASTGSRLLLRSPLLHLTTHRGAPMACAADLCDTPLCRRGHRASGPCPMDVPIPTTKRLCGTVVEDDIGTATPPTLRALPSDPLTRLDAVPSPPVSSVEATPSPFLPVCEHVLATHRSPADLAEAFKFSSRVKPGKGHPNLHLSCSDKIWRWALREARDEMDPSAQGGNAEAGRASCPFPATTVVLKERARREDFRAVSHDAPGEKIETSAGDTKEERPVQPSRSSSQCQSAAEKGVPVACPDRPRQGGGGVLGKRRTPLLPPLSLSSLHVGVPSQCTEAEMAALSAIANTTMASVLRSRAWITGEAAEPFTDPTASPALDHRHGVPRRGAADAPRVDVFRLNELWTTTEDGKDRSGPSPTRVFSPPPLLPSAAPHASVAKRASSSSPALVVDSGYSRVSWLSTRVGEALVPQSPTSWTHQEETEGNHPSLLSSSSPSPTFSPAHHRMKGEAREPSWDGNGRPKRCREDTDGTDTEQGSHYTRKSTADVVGVPAHPWTDPKHFPDDRPWEEAIQTDHETHTPTMAHPSSPFPFLDGAMPPSGYRWRCCVWEWEAREGNRKGSRHSRVEHARDDGWGDDHGHRFATTLPRSSLTLNSKCGLPQGMDEAALSMRYPELCGALPPKSPSRMRNVDGTPRLGPTTEQSTEHPHRVSLSFSCAPLLSSLEPSQSRLRCSMAKEFPLSRAWMFYRVQELTQYHGSVTQVRHGSSKPIAEACNVPFAHYIRSRCDNPRACEFKWNKERDSFVGTESEEQQAQDEVPSSSPRPSTIHHSKDGEPVNHAAPLYASTANSPLCWTIKPRYGDSYRIF